MSALPTSFPATARASDWADEEQAPGHLLVRTRALHFQSDTGTITLPLDRLIIEAGAEGLVCFRDPEQPEWTVCTSELEVLSHPLLSRNPKLRTAAREVRQQIEGRRIIKRAGLFLAALMAVLLLAKLASGWTLNWLVARTPVEEEIELGRRLFTALTNQVQLVQAPQLQARIDQWTRPLLDHLPHHPYTFEFKLVASPEPNAFALPGGTILITTGLFKVVKRPEEVVGVLAHEIAHVLHRHGLKQLIRNAGPYYLLRVFISDRQSFLILLSNTSRFLWEQSFSRRLEREADLEAWHYLTAARIDPRGLRAFLKALHEQQRGSPLSPKLPECLRSHPPDEERLAYLQALWKKERPHDSFITLPPLGRETWGEEIAQSSHNAAFRTWR